MWKRKRWRRAARVHSPTEEKVSPRSASRSLSSLCLSQIGDYGSGLTSGLPAGSGTAADSTRVFKFLFFSSFFKFTLSLVVHTNKKHRDSF